MNHDLRGDCFSRAKPTPRGRTFHPPTLKLVDVCDTPFTFSSKPIRKMNVVVNRDRCWILYVGDAVPHGLNIACRT